jgi:transcriptional regulator with XRE-family HTH domain
MSPKTLKELFEEARLDPGYHKERAIIGFTEELWRVMEEQGVSGTELGRRIGSSQAYISRVLNGGANFTLATMTKLAMALGMELKMHLAPADELTEWRDVPAEQPASTRGEVDPAERAGSAEEGYRERVGEALETAEAGLAATAETVPER